MILYNRILGLNVNAEAMLNRLADRLLSPRVLLPDRRVYARPEDFGLAAEPLEARRRDGCILRGFRIRLEGGGKGGHPPLVVFFPGNSANLSAHLLYVEMLCRAGCEAIALDYAGYGRSDGEARLSGLIEDARAACEGARGLGARGGRDAGKLGLFGVSLGANLALAAAAERSDIGAIAVEGVSLHRPLVEGMFREGTPGPRFLSGIFAEGAPLPERGMCRLRGLRMPPPLASALARAAHALYPFAGKDPLRFAERLEAVPVFVIHGAADRLLPCEGALRLYEALTGAKRLWLLPGAGHAQEPALAADREYAAQLEAFFHRGPGGGRGNAGDEESVAVEREPRPDGSTRLTVSLRDGACEGAYLLSAWGKGALKFFRPWLTRGSRFQAEHPEPAPQVAAIKIHQAERTGETWRPRLSERSALYEERYAAGFREIAARLHEGKAEEALAGLKTLLADPPPPPFNLIARLHAARLEDLAQKKHPQTAREARGLFDRLSRAFREAAVP